MFLAGSDPSRGSLCSNNDNLISASCDGTSFTITVNETCRGSHYSWIDFNSTFVDGNVSTVEMPDPLGATCKADGAGTAWEYSFAFTECNVGPATGPTAGGAGDPAGVEWWTYSVYLNFDNTIAAALGTGNLLQLNQTLVKILII